MGTIVRFDDFELDPAARELRRTGVRIRVQDFPLQLLSALVERPGEVVTREELRSQLWPSDTFVEFDQSLNTAVKKLRQALGDSADEPRFVETLARKGYRFLRPVERIGAEAAEPATLPSPLRSRRTWLVTFLALTIIAAAVSFFYFGPALRHRTFHSVVVLPFVNLTGDGKQGYLADAVTDSLINQLASSRTLRVISRTSAMRYRGSKKSAAELARELNVDAVVEGSLSRDGGRLRVNAQLIDGATDETLWAREYQRAATEMAGMQSELTQALAAQLDDALAGRAVTRTCSAEGYDLFIRGRAALNEGQQRDLETAAELLRHAVTVSPDCAPAYSGLAEVALFRGGRLPIEAMLEAKTAAERALALDPSLAEAHSSVAMVRMYLDHDWAGAEQEFRTALSLQPQRAETHHRLGVLLAARGRFDEAAAEGKRAVDLDPLAPLMRVDLGRIDYMARQYDQGIAVERDVLRTDPSIELAHTFISAPLLVQHRFDDAWAEVRAGMELSPQRRALLPAIDARVRLLGTRGALLENARQRSEAADRAGWVPTSWLATTFSALGEREAALHHVELAARSHTRDSIFIAVDPVYDPIRDDPRFQKVLHDLRIR